MIESILYSALSVLGMMLIAVRLRMVAHPGASLYCHVRWWVWVLSHVLMMIAFFAKATRPLYGDAEPYNSEWFMALGVILYLLLKVRRRPTVEHVA